MTYHHKISFEEAQELPDLTPEEEQEERDRYEWESFLASIPTPYERNRWPWTQQHKPSLRPLS